MIGKDCLTSTARYLRLIKQASDFGMLPAPEGVPNIITCVQLTPHLKNVVCLGCGLALGPVAIVFHETAPTGENGDGFLHLACAEEIAVALQEMCAAAADYLNSGVPESPKIYFGDFDSEAEMIRAFQQPVPPDMEVIFATYDNDQYSGYAFVLLKKDGVLYEVNGDHCSCFGLEDQFVPEETTAAALKHRLEQGHQFERLDPEALASLRILVEKELFPLMTVQDLVFAA